MIAVLTPDLVVESVFDLTAERLREMKIALLLVDLDNTLSPYGKSRPTPELRQWVLSLTEVGIEPVIVSNNRGDRPMRFARSLGVDFVGRAGKPSVERVGKVLLQRGIYPDETALAGDQIFTDVLCAKRLGALAIAVRPISLRNPFRLARYALELPFRRK